MNNDLSTMPNYEVSEEMMNVLNERISFLENENREQKETLDYMNSKYNLLFDKMRSYSNQLNDELIGVDPFAYYGFQDLNMCPTIGEEMGANFPDYLEANKDDDDEDFDPVIYGDYSGLSNTGIKRSSAADSFDFNLYEFPVFDPLNYLNNAGFQEKSRLTTPTVTDICPTEYMHEGLDDKEYNKWWTSNLHILNIQDDDEDDDQEDDDDLSDNSYSSMPSLISV